MMIESVTTKWNELVHIVPGFAIIRYIIVWYGHDIAISNLNLAITANEFRV